jgi:8-oxo-dGTP pyrophosphatase MutT (NUDIX family)
MNALDLDLVRRAMRLRPAERLSTATKGQAAVALVLRSAPGKHALELLFIRRAEHPRDPWSGQIAFPGGRAEAHDPDLLATAMRETHEETGLDLQAEAELLGPLDEVRAMARLRPVDLSIQPFVFRLHGPGQARPSPEAMQVHWLPVDELLREEHRTSMDFSWQGTTLKFPCLRLADVVIWGLTYRMFMGLAERLRLA